MDFKKLDFEKNYLQEINEEINEDVNKVDCEISTKLVNLDYDSILMDDITTNNQSEEKDIKFLNILAKMHNTTPDKITCEYKDEGIYWKVYKINDIPIWHDPR